MTARCIAGERPSWAMSLTAPLISPSWIRMAGIACQRSRFMVTVSLFKQRCRLPVRRSPPSLGCGPRRDRSNEKFYEPAP